MKRMLIAAAFIGVCSASFADGYVGSVVSRGTMSYRCSDGLACKDGADFFKVYAGSRIDSEHQIDVGVGKIDALEMTYLRVKKPHASGFQGVSGYDSNTGVTSPTSPTARQVPVNFQLSADMLTLAAVAHIAVFDDFVLGVKGGAAYVSATIKKDFNGASNNAMTANKIKPYVGLDVQYRLIDGLKLVGAVDLTQYEVSGTKGSIRSIGVGAEYAY